MFHWECCVTSRLLLNMCGVVARQRGVGALKLMLGRHNGSAPVSSFSIPSIDVKSQSYFFTYTVKTMTVTSTARGITGKQLLVGTVNDQVLGPHQREREREREQSGCEFPKVLSLQPKNRFQKKYQIIKKYSFNL